MIIDWKKYFDQIYCIAYLPEFKNRHNRTLNALNRVGIIDSGIFRWKYTIDSPIYNILQKNSKHNHIGPQTNIKVFKCSLAHYEIIKDAQILGYNRILILEEDIVFHKDISLIQKILDNMPNFDIILLDKFCYNAAGYENEKRNSNNIINDYYRSFNEKSILFGSSACYSLNKFAINEFTKIYEDGWQCADGIWNERCSDNMTKCYAIQNIGIQKSFNNANSESNKFDVYLAYHFVQLNGNNYEI